MEEVEEVKNTNATSEQTLVTVNEEGGQQENADPLLLDEEHDAERILHAAANARRGMKGKLGLQESKDTKQSRVMTTDGTSSNANDNEVTTSPIVRTVSGDLDDSEDEEGEEDYTLTIHSHWDQEKVSVKDPYDMCHHLDTTRSIAAMYENSPSSTYASVAAHSRPSIGAGTFASDALADTEARSTASHDTSAQSNTNKDTAQERGFAPGSGLMVKLAAKGAAEEVSDFVEDTTDTYLLGKPPTSLVTSVKEQLTQTLASAAADDDDDEENNTRWKCKTCREERARDASWLNWITHPVTMVLDHIHSSNDEDEPCDQHRTITQKLTYLMPKWMRSKRQHSKSSYNKSKSISNDDKSQQYYSISVTSNAYVNAEQDGYGRRISQVERARRMRLAQQAQQRVNMLRGGNDNGAATTAAVDDDGKTNQQSGIVVRVVGTVVGTAVGISMAAIDAVWH
ncbi:hypothetical protein BDF22DRAFT_697040 [Syncephalis plumigaleata]|nr:hypothetical protein BDF22DRAFT_697040 [Syncephalis plumigaleata]